MAKLTAGSVLRNYYTLIFYSTVSNIIFSTLGLAMPWMLGLAIDNAFPTGDYKFLAILAGIMLSVYALRCAMRYIAGYIGSYTVMRILVDLRLRVFRHLQSLSLRFYDDYRAGKLISNVINDVTLVQQMVANVMSAADQAFTVIVVGGALVFLNWRLALVLLALAPLRMLPRILFRSRMKGISLAMQERVSEVTATLSENIHGIRIVKSFAREHSEVRSFFTSLRPLIGIGIKQNLFGNFTMMIVDVSNLLTCLTVIFFGVYYYQRGEMTLGEFVTFYTYIGAFMAPFVFFANLNVVFAQGAAGLKRVSDLLAVVPEINDAPNAVKAGTLRGDIEFDDVSFRYKDAPVIEHLNLKIPAGHKIALVGPSGCGKSTLSNLLLRFYDVTGGVLRVDGRDIREYSQQSYHENVGVVLQEPFLFSGTIRENIAYARSDASREEVIAAARMANVEEFVNTLPDGYETVIGENGTSLSGGQRQRIAIARAILKNPSILILDEATSALDTVSERLVQQALDNLMAGRTTIIIAHRLSTIRNADNILVMRQGRVIQQGSHEELMAQPDGVYCRLYNAQMENGSEHMDYSNFKVNNEQKPA